ncbi:uncharacterized protein BX664DRAFT_315769 [Halteromyces radiatus]|uniref:uncharacterized protein n=1 Tax=Halteromyces radiatus TaxID=101107 RepID=UPI002220E90F|nr:uncharacterized protein BX664DRAFT_315769 [Halteromyces radiatus]KAI8086584.1 hypothetical protein BX664DRAFT_315769 [Halteromyces radiatus]
MYLSPYRVFVDQWRKSPSSDDIQGDSILDKGAFYVCPLGAGVLIFSLLASLLLPAAEVIMVPIHQEQSDFYLKETRLLLFFYGIEGLIMFISNRASNQAGTNVIMSICIHNLIKEAMMYNELSCNKM